MIPTLAPLRPWEPLTASPIPGYHLVYITSNCVFPFPMCPPPLPTACGLALLPLLWPGLCTAPVRLPSMAPGRTMAGHWGLRNSRPASSAWATTWRMTGRYAHPGAPADCGINCSSFSLSSPLPLTVPPAIPAVSLALMSLWSLSPLPGLSGPPASLLPPLCCLSAVHMGPTVGLASAMPASWEQKQTGSMDSDDFRALLISTGYSLVCSLCLPCLCSSPSPSTAS